MTNDGLCLPLLKLVTLFIIVGSMLIGSYVYWDMDHFNTLCLKELTAGQMQYHLLSSGPLWHTDDNYEKRLRYSYPENGFCPTTAIHFTTAFVALSATCCGVTSILLMMITCASKPADYKTCDGIWHFLAGILMATAASLLVQSTIALDDFMSETDRLELRYYHKLVAGGLASLSVLFCWISAVCICMQTDVTKKVKPEEVQQEVIQHPKPKPRPANQILAEYNNNQVQGQGQGGQSVPQYTNQSLVQYNYKPVAPVQPHYAVRPLYYMTPNTYQNQYQAQPIYQYQVPRQQPQYQAPYQQRQQGPQSSPPQGQGQNQNQYQSQYPTPIAMPPPPPTPTPQQPLPPPPKQDENPPQWFHSASLTDSTAIDTGSSESPQPSEKGPPPTPVKRPTPPIEPPPKRVTPPVVEKCNPEKNIPPPPSVSSVTDSTAIDTGSSESPQPSEKGPPPTPVKRPDPPIEPPPKRVAPPVVEKRKTPPPPTTEKENPPPPSTAASDSTAIESGSSESVQPSEAPSRAKRSMRSTGGKSFNLPWGGTPLVKPPPEQSNKRKGDEKGSVGSETGSDSS